MPTLLVHEPSGSHRVPFELGASAREALAPSVGGAAYGCAGTGACGLCRVHVVSGAVPLPTAIERERLRAEELAAGVRLACQLRPDGDVTLEVEGRAESEPWVDIDPATLPRVGLPARPELAGAPLGVAVDLGTTHLRVSLWDLARGFRLGARRGSNPQGTFGADVLSRLAAARGSERAAGELARVIREAVMTAASDILAGVLAGGFGAPVNSGATNSTPDARARLAESVSSALVVGNTAMLALLCGRRAEALLEPDHWDQRLDVGPPDAGQWPAAWGWPRATVAVAPPVAGFVGSDLAADALATGLIDGPAGSLLLDVGTNTEVALWDGHTLHATSAAGGPAFEGAGTLCGVPFGPGAIVRVRREQGAFRCESVGGVPARGLCAAGLVDAVAALLDEGLLRPSGRMAGAAAQDGVRLDPSNPHTAISPRDVDALQRAKASVAAAIEVLLAQAKLRWTDLQRVFVCGAFGSGLAVASAQRVGLLPPVLTTRVELWPEASLAGCERALVSGAGARLLAEIASRGLVRNLSAEPSYEDRFVRRLRLEPIDPAIDPA